MMPSSACYRNLPNPVTSCKALTFRTDPAPTSGELRPAEGISSEVDSLGLLWFPQLAALTPGIWPTSRKSVSNRGLVPAPNLEGAFPLPEAYREHIIRKDDFFGSPVARGWQCAQQ